MTKYQERPMTEHDKLVSAATQYDMKLTKRDGNIYRLGLILGRLADVEAQVKLGDSYAAALYDNFSDRLLSTFEKALGLPLTYRGGREDKGRPA